MVRTSLLAGAALIALAIPAMAQQNTATQAAAVQAAASAAATPEAAQNQTAFSQALKSIRDWFGADVPEQAAAPQAADTTTAAADDTLQVPPQLDGNAPQNIEPAAGFDDDMLQTPPPYYGPQSDATPRATSFDNSPSVAAFGDMPPQPVANANVASPEAIANIAPAAGDVPMDRSQLDCDAILKAAENAEEGDRPEAALVTACKEAPPAADGTGVPAVEAPATMMPANPALEPAQPAFEPSIPQPAPSSLPATQPAAGDAAQPEAAAPANTAPDNTAPATQGAVPTEPAAQN